MSRSIGNIAEEKAGIIKRNVPVVTAAKGKALEVINKTCEANKTHLIMIKKCALRELKSRTAPNRRYFPGPRVGNPRF